MVVVGDWDRPNKGHTFEVNFFCTTEREPGRFLAKRRHCAHRNHFSVHLTADVTLLGEIFRLEIHCTAEQTKIATVSSG